MTTHLILVHRQDPGHGWLQVRHDLIAELGVGQAISHYSYRDHEFAYLEEDCDAGVFLDAATAVGITYDLHSTEDGAFIRQLRPYKAGSRVHGR